MDFHVTTPPTSSGKNLVEVLFENDGFLTRKAKSDAPFWYTSNEPGPFYITSHRVVGQELADHLLAHITQAMKGDEKEAIESIAAEVEARLKDNDHFRRIIEQMAANCAELGYDFSTSPISGGERKDWIFSYPLALTVGCKHYWLTKSHNCYDLVDGKAVDIAHGGDSVYHVTDIIHKGASFVDSWLPALGKSGLSLNRTLSVFCRSEIGKDRLTKEGIAFDILRDFDMSNIRAVRDAGLISAEICDDIDLFFTDRGDWMRSFIDTVDVDAVARQVGSSDTQRIVTFVDTDPYDLKSHAAGRFQDLAEAVQKAQSA